MFVHVYVTVVNVKFIFPISADASQYCQANPNDIVPISDNCAEYIDCLSVGTGPVGGPVKECKYPDLFSKVTMSCVNFTTVVCDKRREPMAPCKYNVYTISITLYMANKSVVFWTRSQCVFNTKPRYSPVT